MIKKLLYIIPILLLLAMSPSGGADDQPDFPLIYIDEGCAGTHVGSLANPYDDLADINWTTGGDNSVHDGRVAGKDVVISLMRGDTWRETMTVGTSGSAAHPITIQAYGDGAKPIINGSDLVETWTEIDMGESGGVCICDAEEGDTTDWTGTTADGGNTYAATEGSKNNGSYGFESDFDGTNINAYGTKSFTEQTDIYVRFYIKLNNGFSTAATYKSNIVFLLEDGGVDLVRVAIERTGVGTFQLRAACLAPWTDLSNWQIVDDTWYRVEVRYKGDDASTGGVEWWIDGASISSNYTNNTLGRKSDSVLVGLFDGVDSDIPTAASDLYIDDVKVDTSPIGAYDGGANIWQATLATEPEIVIFDGVVGTKETDVVSLSAENEWFWEASVLYVYSTGDPDEDYDEPGIEAGARDYGIYSDGKSYITTDGIEVKYTNKWGIGFKSGSNGIIKNCTVSNISQTADSSRGYGIYLLQTGANNEVSDNTVSDVYHTGICIQPAYGRPAVDISTTLVYGNDIDDCGGNGMSIICAQGVKVYNNNIDGCADNVEKTQGVTFWNSSTCEAYSNTIADVYDPINSTDVAGLATYESDHIKIYYNRIDDCRVGIHLDANSDSPSNEYSHDNEVYYNIVSNCSWAGVHVEQEEDDTTVYNNTLYHNVDSIRIDGDNSVETDNLLVKNNIVVKKEDVGGGMCLHVGPKGLGSNCVIDYNCYYGEEDGSNEVIWWDEENSKTYKLSQFATWKSDTGYDSNSIATDPLMTDPANDDFMLNPHSPCVNAGTDVGLTEDYQGLKIRHAPDIGAHENQANAIFFAMLRFITGGM